MINLGSAMRADEQDERIREWWAQHGRSLTEALGIGAPDEVFCAALRKLKEVHLYVNPANWSMFPCHQTRNAKRVIEPFIRGGQPTDIAALRIAFVIQNMNLVAACEALHFARKNEHRIPPYVRHKRVFKLPHRYRPGQSQC